MGRNHIVIDPMHYIVFGFDHPTGGYFADYYDTTTPEYAQSEQPQDGIMGVSKNRIFEFLEKHHALDHAKKQKPIAFDKLLLDLPC